MEKLNDVITAIDDFVWGPVMLILLVGTGIFLTIRTRFLTWRNLGYALKSTLSKEARTKSHGEGDVSPFSALTTALAATIGTGNIVGVATAMVSGGPGALVWMWISAAFGLTSKFSECMLAIKYREINAKGEMSGGPMYTMKKALKNKRFIVIIGNISNLPAGILMIFQMAFSVKAVGGGLCGTIVASMMNAMRYGVARGVFSNEAGMGSAAITAAAATTDNPVRQGYINMTGTFWDTIVVCTITGLAIASSGVLGMTDAAGNMLTGSDVTIAAFETVLGSAGGWLVTIGITLFAFSTILGWEYHGEKAFEYLLGTHRFNMVYRLVFSFVVYFGCTQTLNLVWSFSDIANALMAIPNLICMLLLSGEIAKDIREFQKEIHKYN